MKSFYDLCDEDRTSARSQACINPQLTARYDVLACYTLEVYADELSSLVEPITKPLNQELDTRGRIRLDVSKLPKGVSAWQRPDS